MKSELSRPAKLWLSIFGFAALAYLSVCLLVGLNQRSLLFFPTHKTEPTSLSPWIINGKIIGYCRVVSKPQAVWLMTHGNGGQADGRAYVLPRMTKTDSLYVLEYPGYGLRAGQPSRETMNAAALAGYEALRKAFPDTPIGVIGESIGSGPASYLASTALPPDKIVLVVPFDSLASVASEHMPFLPVRLMLRDDWDNITALQSYSGPIEIYGAINDEIIGYDHARNLAAHLCNGKLVGIPGGHNDWSQSDQVRIER